MRHLTLGLISSSRGTAGLPPFIAFGTSSPNPRPLSFHSVLTPATRRGPHLLPYLRKRKVSQSGGLASNWWAPGTGATQGRRLMTNSAMTGFELLVVVDAAGFHEHEFRRHVGFCRDWRSAPGASCRISALGQKQTFSEVRAMSALPPKRTWTSAGELG